jgi:hypothetical protein
MFASPTAAAPPPFQDWNWAMSICLGGSDSQFRSAVHDLTEASVDQFLSAVFRAVEIRPVRMDHFVDLICESPHPTVRTRLEHTAKVFLVADVVDRLTSPELDADWAGDLAIRSEFIRKLTERGAIRRSVLCRYLQRSRRLTNVLALVLGITPKENGIPKEQWFMQTVSDRLAYNSTITSESAEAAVFADSFDGVTDADLNNSFHSFREAPSLLALSVYAGAVNCFRALLARNPQITEARIPEIAVRSGNLTIIRTLVALGVDFRAARRAAIRYHQHDLFDQIADDVRPSDLWLCVHYQNGELIRRHAAVFATYALEEQHALCIASVRCHFAPALEWLLGLGDGGVPVDELVREAVEHQETECLAVLVRAGRVLREAAALAAWAEKRGHRALLQELSACDHARAGPAARVSFRSYVFLHAVGLLERLAIHNFWSGVYNVYRSRGEPVPALICEGRIVQKGIPLRTQGIRKHSILHGLGR